MSTERYTTRENAAEHVCWLRPDWQDVLSVPGECAACDEARETPCRFCFYGLLFATHTPIIHFENADRLMPTEPYRYSTPWELARFEKWAQSPHDYA